MNKAHGDRSRERGEVPRRSGSAIKLIDERLVDHREEERPNHHHRKANEQANAVSTNKALKENKVDHRDPFRFAAGRFAAGGFVSGRLVTVRVVVVRFAGARRVRLSGVATSGAIWTVLRVLLP